MSLPNPEQVPNYIVQGIIDYLNKEICTVLGCGRQCRLIVTRYEIIETSFTPSLKLVVRVRVADCEYNDLLVEVKHKNDSTIASELLQVLEVNADPSAPLATI
ncbi:hypothetical protein ACOME3_007300 [Neoechinorhynchus agilis]